MTIQYRTTLELLSQHARRLVDKGLWHPCCPLGKPRFSRTRAQVDLGWPRRRNATQYNEPANRETSVHLTTEEHRGSFRISWPPIAAYVPPALGTTARTGPRLAINKCILGRPANHLPACACTCTCTCPCMLYLLVEALAEMGGVPLHRYRDRTMPSLGWPSPNDTLPLNVFLSALRLAHAPCVAFCFLTARSPGPCFLGLFIERWMTWDNNALVGRLSLHGALAHTRPGPMYITTTYRLVPMSRRIQ
jgi:hypothetical protein